MRNIFLVVVTLFLFSGCFTEGEKKWTSLIYPDKTNTKRLIQNGIFNSLNECQEASKLKLQELEVTIKGSYNCGLNCKYNEGFKSYICQELK